MRIGSMVILVTFCLCACRAQFVFAVVGVDGLTCSLCARMVENSLLKLDFIQEVHMDLNAVEAVVKFVPDRKVSVKRLADAVSDAGFSVREIKATFHFTRETAPESACWTHDGVQYLVLEGNISEISGPTEFIFLNKYCMPPKRYKFMRKKFPQLERPPEDCPATYFLRL